MIDCSDRSGNHLNVGIGPQLVEGTWTKGRAHVCTLFGFILPTSSTRAAANHRTTVISRLFMFDRTSPKVPIEDTVSEDKTSPVIMLHTICLTQWSQFTEGRKKYATRVEHSFRSTKAPSCALAKRTSHWRRRSSRATVSGAPKLSQSLLILTVNVNAPKNLTWGSGLRRS